MTTNWHEIKIHDEAELLRKEMYVYQLQGEQFDIELFETREGKYYAIGTPRDSERLIIYGSAIVDHAHMALAQTIKKIERDQLQRDIAHVGEDVRDVEE